ncbi:hypothetical protein [Actinomadura coerulea]|uniref:hypothetical protein n=1 Tax=Actinomadura coerulea TaxID=46159 RepID=UPI0034359E73
MDPAELDDAEIDAVNAALFLRRPLLVTGEPGSGKSHLGYQVARELRLGRVLRWLIGSRSTLRGGLREFDAIGATPDAATSRGTLACRSGGSGDALVEGDLGAAALTGRSSGEHHLGLGLLGNRLLPHELRAPRRRARQEPHQPSQRLPRPEEVSHHGPAADGSSPIADTPNPQGAAMLNDQVNAAVIVCLSALILIAAVTAIVARQDVTRLPLVLTALAVALGAIPAILRVLLG